MNVKVCDWMAQLEKKKKRFESDRKEGTGRGTTWGTDEQTDGKQKVNKQSKSGTTQTDGDKQAEEQIRQTRLKPEKK